MNEDTQGQTSQQDILRMTTEVVAAYVGNNVLPTSQISEVINTVHKSLNAVQGAAGRAQAARGKPAVAIRRSITPDYIVCLEDGKKLKMLKRHVRTAFNLTPDTYRAKWGLPADYPMVAPNYAAQRSAFAKKIGLGRKGAGGKRKGRATRKG